MQKLAIPTAQKKQIVDLTGLINDLLMKNFYDSGICMLFATHTSCSLAIADLDPGSEADYLNAFEAMVPKLNYVHPHDPTHVGDHILSSVIGMSLSVPVQSARMVLGTWQKVVLFEFNGPKERRIIVNFIPVRERE